MFSQERRERLIASLKKDPVPVSEVFFETVAEVEGDMVMLDLDNRLPKESDEDKIVVNKNALSFIEIIKNIETNDLNKAIDLMEEVFALRDKYDSLRFQGVVA
ncbi:MAG: hypothetical protein IJR44_05675 [Neisseriaceae bacterium]|nr:hypothetical protein [Neisseriaceae bacterium]MBQ9619968.1 hypothetical protein [Neisseriaceae bacterium]MBR0129395.1 hypothetical protein [Neisseriaceae bacterium]